MVEVAPVGMLPLRQFHAVARIAGDTAAFDCSAEYLAQNTNDGDDGGWQPYDLPTGYGARSSSTASAITAGR